MIACLVFKKYLKLVMALSYEGNSWLYWRFIRSTFINDDNEKLSYLEISRDFKVGKLTFEDDKVITIYGLELIIRIYRYLQD